MAAKPRYLSPFVKGRRNRAADVRSIAQRYLGFDLYPWQKEITKSITQFDPDTGIPFYRTNVITVPRQAGKSWFTYALMTELALRVPFSNIAFTAQTRLSAARRLSDLGSLLTRAGVEVKVYRGVGSEKVTFPNGSRIDVISPSERGFHGDSIDYAVFDEIWAVDEIVLQGLIPAMSARPNAQLIGISTMGTPDSTLLNRWVEQGREAANEKREEGIFYVEYSAGEEDDPFTEETWRKVHPAVGKGVSIENIRSAMEAMLPNEFRRAYANQLVDAIDAALPWDLWQSVYRSNVEIPPSNLTVAVDVGLGPDAASIAMAWPVEKEGAHSELVEHRFGNLEWLIPTVAALLDKRPIRNLVIDAVGPARTIASELEQVCFQRGVNFFKPQSSDIAAACSLYFDGIRQATFTHGPAQPLDDAVRGLVLRNIGDQYVWGRRQSRHDVSPLYASTLAAWSVNEQRIAPTALAIW